MPDSNIFTKGNWAFQIESDNTLTLLEYIGKSLDVINIPNDIDGIPITHIKPEFLNGQKDTVRTIIFRHDSLVEVIPDDTFYNFENLHTVKLPDNLKRIGDRTFADCKNLKNCEIPKMVVYIGTAAFAYCPSLNGTLYIPPSVKGIGGNCFLQSGINKVICEANISTLRSGTFLNCPNLAEIEFRTNNLTTLDELCIADSDNLENVSGLKSVMVMYPNSIYNCIRLKSVRCINPRLNIINSDMASLKKLIPEIQSNAKSPAYKKWCGKINIGPYHSKLKNAVYKPIQSEEER